MIAYFNPPNEVAAMAIAKAFGLTRVDADGVERMTSTHEGSAIWTMCGDGEDKAVKRLIIQTHIPALNAILAAHTSKTSAPASHKI